MLSAFSSNLQGASQQQLGLTRWAPGYPNINDDGVGISESQQPPHFFLRYQLYRTTPPVSAPAGLESIWLGRELPHLQTSV